MGVAIQIFGVPSAVTSLVCGPLLFNSASGNGTTVGHGWGVAVLWIYAIQFQWLLRGTKALHRPVFARSVAIPEKSGKKTKQS